MLNIPSTKLVNDEIETAVLAAEFAQLLKPGDKVILNGTLGSGKTFFIKKVLSYHNILDVTSPTFAIVNEYRNYFRFYHFDFYRLKNYKELLDAGWNDYMNDDDAISFVEWGNLIPKALPNKRIEITIKYNEGTKREIEFGTYE